MKVRRHVFVALSFAAVVSGGALPVWAQIHTDHVDIGLDGIHVHTDDGQNVDIGIRDGIQVNTKDGARVNLGKKGPIVSTGNSARVAAGSNFVAMSLAQQVTIIEQQVVGRTSESLPLAERVTQLEKNNLGRVGTGSLKDRVQVLIRELGVQMPASMVAPQPGAVQQQQVQSTRSAVQMRANDSVVRISGGAGNSNVAANGRPVSIDGAENRVTISGGTPLLTINGADNWVSVDGVDKIVITGATNHVQWHKGLTAPRPAIDDSGYGNKVVQSTDR